MLGKRERKKTWRGWLAVALLLLVGLEVLGDAVRRARLNLPWLGTGLLLAGGAILLAWAMVIIGFGTRHPANMLIVLIGGVVGVAGGATTLYERGYPLAAMILAALAIALCPLSAYLWYQIRRTGLPRRQQHD